MNKYRIAVAASLTFGLLAGGPAVAQSSTIDAVMGICTGVIEEQYNDDRARDGQCVGAVTEFLAAINAPSADTDSLITDLVAQLAELYRDDTGCKISQTELPEAIQTASQGVAEQEITVELVAISEQIDSCEFEATAVIDDTFATEA